MPRADDIASLAGRDILDRLGRWLAPGAVFRIPDRFTVPAGTSARSHPCVVVGPVPSLDEAPDLVVARPLRIAYRESWKPERHDRPPATLQEEMQLLQDRQWVFSRRGTLRGCDRDGLFRLYDRRWVPIRLLVACPFLGFLPQPAIDWLLARMTGQRVPDPYPPE